MAKIHQLRPNAQAVEEWGGYFPSERLERPKPRQWIVDGMIPRGTVTLVSGAPKVAKSYLLLQLFASSVLELPWIGRHVEKVKCLGLFLEDDKDELDGRLWNIAEAYGTDISKLNFDIELNPREWLSTKLLRFPRGSEEPIWTPLGELFWEVVGESGYSLLVVDTATAALGSPARWDGDKSFNAVQLIRRKVAEHNAAFILTDHTPKNSPGSFYGPNTWHGSVRAAMNLRVPHDEFPPHDLMRNKRLLTDLGGNYGSFEPITLKWDNNILVPEKFEPLEKRPKSFEEKMDFDNRLLGFLQECVRRNAPVMADWAHPKSLTSRVKRVYNIPMNDIHAAEQRLLDHKRATLVKLDGKCVIRPMNFRYRGEEPWSVTTES